MPQGGGKGQDNLLHQGHKVFIGKGKLEIPALRNVPKSVTETKILSDGEGPSPLCRSTTLSRFTSVSQESGVTIESTPSLFAQTHHAPKQMRNKYAANEIPMEITPNHPNARRECLVSALQSGVIDRYSENQTENDFVASASRREEIEQETSHLSGPMLVPESSKRLLKIHCSTQRSQGTCIADDTINHFTQSKEYFPISGRARSIPGLSLLRKASSEDFVDISKRTPPPDFIEPSSSMPGVQTIASQPELSVMLSGAVSKSALLKQKLNFVPTAVMPENKLRSRSKSLSDLSKRNDKTRRFLDRKRVIQMDLADEECCSHTNVAPSSMMTLAMELLVSRDNRAATLFNEAKMRADNSTGENDSTLPNLWVVSRVSSGDCSRKTASHLKPVVKTERRDVHANMDENLDESAKSVRPLKENQLRTEGKFKPLVAQSSGTPTSDHYPPPKNVTSEEWSSLERSPGSVVMRRKTARPLPSTVRCIALSEQVTDDHNLALASQSGAKIRQEDIDHDLRTLTVADLVGSPDTVLNTDTESEFDASECIQRMSANENDERVGNICSKSFESTGKPSCADVNSLIVQANDEVVCFHATSPSEREKSVSLPDTRMSSLATVKEKNAHIKMAHEGKRRSSSASVSSSFTTVSSLSLSSNSMASLDLTMPSDVSKTPKAFPASLENDFGTPERKEALQEFKYPLQNPFGETCHQSTEFLPPVVSNLLEENDANAAPPLPKRTKSFQVVDKIRSSLLKKAGSSKEKWTEYRDAIKLTDCGKDRRTFHLEECNAYQRGDKANATPKDEHTLHNTKSNGMAKHLNQQASEHQSAIDAVPEHLLRPSLLTAPCALGEFCGRGQADALGKTARVPLCKETPCEGDFGRFERNAIKYHTGQDLSRKPYRTAGDCLTSSRPLTYADSGVHTRQDMENERTFRNGEICVTDGSRVSLSRNCNRQASTQSVSPVGVYLSDILNSKELHESQSGLERRTEDPIAPTDAAGLQSGSGVVTSPWEEATPREIDDKMKDRSVAFTKQGILRKVFVPTDDDQSPGCVETKSSISVQADVNYATTKSNPGAHGLESSSAEPYYGVAAAKRTGNSKTDTVYDRSSAIKLLTGKNVYSSTVRISLNPTLSKKSASTERRESWAGTDASTAIGHGNAVMQGRSHSVAENTKTQARSDNRAPASPSQGKSGSKHKTVGEVGTEDMKVSEKLENSSQELPAHSAVDEGDFAGVVDGPTKNVKEIRAMFKGPDYANYAKPKSLSKNTSGEQSHHEVPVEAKRNERSAQNENRKSAEVAQQVIGLFKGALTLNEVDDAPHTTSKQHQTSFTDGKTEAEEPRISMKEKVASFNCGRSPVKDAEVNGNGASEIITKSEVKPEMSQTCTDVISIPSSEANGHAKKSAIKNEKVNADSYDESLDQFYDVLEELTTS